jgi:hypothetical protein
MMTSCGTSTSEPGLDVFRRQPDGSWKIVRCLAFEGKHTVSTAA